MERSRIGIAMVRAMVVTLLLPVAARAGSACVGYETVLFCGDLNGDCKITASDALIALRIGVGQLPVRSEADVDNSRAVSAKDALRILRISVGTTLWTNSCDYQYGVNATASGFYIDDGSHVADNYAVGWYTGNDDEVHDYFVFDLSAIPGSIYLAMLHVSAGPTNQSLYSSPDPSETFRLFSVTTAIDTVKNGGGGVPAFTDLGDGTVYGEFLGTSSIPSIVNVPLNAAGLQYLNSASSKVAFGGAITTLQKGEFSERLFNSTGSSSLRQLIVQVDTN